MDNVVDVRTSMLVEELNEVYNKKQTPEETVAEMLELLDRNRDVLEFDSALKDAHRLLNIWSRTESEAPKYLVEVKTLVGLYETKTFEVGFRVSGSVMVTAENQTKAMEYLKNSDQVSTYELFEGIANNIIDAGNDAISIDHVWETEDVPTEEIKHAVVHYNVICGESHISKKKLISFIGSNIDEAIHEYFKDYWGEEETRCGDTGYRYSRSDWQESINIGHSIYVSAFEAEILKKFL